MKNTLKILSLLMVLVLVLSVFAACDFPGTNPGTTGTTPTVDNTTNPGGTDEPTGDTKVKVYWCQGQKVLREDEVEIGSLVKDWTPTVSGKEFLGWYSNPGCTTKFDFSKPITAETEIFASFKTTGQVDPVEPEYADYYAIGTGKGSLSVSGWNHENSATKLGMSSAGNGTYTITLDFYAGDMFQICHNLSWDGQMGLGCITGAALVDGSETQGEVKDAEGNVVFTGTQEYSNPMTAWNITCAEGQDGKYKFTLDTITGAITWELVEKLDPNDLPPVVDNNTYTLAGDEALAGTAWNPSYANNDLTFDEATGLWTITLENIAAGTYGFKICVNYGWSLCYGDASNPPDGNYPITVANDGTTVVVTFDASTYAITAKDADGNDLHGGSSGGTGETPDSEIIFAGTMNNWDTTNADGLWALTVGEDGKTWTGTLVVTEDMYADWTVAELGQLCAAVKLYDKGTGTWLAYESDKNLALTVGTYHFKYVVGDANFTYWADGEDEPTTPVDPNPSVPTEDTVIYFQPTTGAEGCWDAYCEGYAMYVWNDEGDLWIVMDEIDTELSLYSATLPAGYTKIIFVSLKSLAAGGDWGNKDSQTVDLTLPADGSNLFTLEESWNGDYDWKGTGSWSVK